MRILISAAFVAITLAYLFLSHKQQKLEVARLGKPSPVWQGIAFQVTFLTLLFAGFSVLTGVLLPGLWMLMIGVALVGQFVYIITGAVAGFWLEETRRKIAILAAARNFESSFAMTVEGRVPIPLFLTIALGLTAVAVGLFGGLWVYWRYPHGIGDTNARIALVQFTIPGLCGNLLAMLLLWPAVASEYVDDDARNASLAVGFTATALLTIYVLLPVWLFRGDFGSVLSATAIPLWLVLSAPFVVFLFVYVVPFFLGMYMHRNQAKKMLEWHRTWLQRLLTTSQLPAGDTRAARIHESLEEIDAEIVKHSSRSPMLRLFHYIATGTWMDSRVKSPAHLALPELSGALAVTGSGAAGSGLDDDLTVHVRLRELKTAVKDPGGALVDLLWSNRAELIAWDLRLSHTGKLLEIRALAQLAETNDLKEPITLELKDVEERLKRQPARKNVMAAALVSVVTVVVPWLFKTWEPTIVSTLSGLMK
jgi:hypothetical protein